MQFCGAVVVLLAASGPLRVRSLIRPQAHLKSRAKRRLCETENSSFWRNSSQRHLRFFSKAHLMGRLEATGRLEAKLYCCSADILRDVRDGKLASATNDLGSYASAHASPGDGVKVVVMRDLANIMLRTALITTGPQDAEGAETI